MTEINLSGRIARMDLHLIPREALTDEQRVELRILTQRHREELPGLLDDWDTQPPCVHTFAVYDRARARFVGIVTWSGMPQMASPAWWIAHKGQGYGRSAINLLALEMKREGVTGLTPCILIQTRQGLYDEPSIRLVRQLRRHFG